jgi:ribosomal protein S13
MFGQHKRKQTYDKVADIDVNEWLDYINSKSKVEGTCKVFDTGNDTKRLPYLKIENIGYTLRCIIGLKKFGKLFKDPHVRTSCEERKCINKEHLFFLSGELSIPKMTVEDKRYFKWWMSTQMRIEEGHHIWTGVVHQTSDYGSVCFGSNKHTMKMSAHAFSWFLANNKEVPKGQIIRHKCKMKLCINADHLEPGSHKENAADRIRDGTHPGGINNPRCTLTEDKVMEIFRSKGNGTIAERCKRFNVKPNIIIGIDYGQSWTHLTGLKKVNYKRKREKKEVNDMTEEEFRTVEDRILSKTKVIDGHLVWQGHIHRGRAMMTYKGKQHQVPRFYNEAKNRRAFEGGRYEKGCDKVGCIHDEHWKYVKSSKEED